jgi:hypothetical protein
MVSTRHADKDPFGGLSDHFEVSQGAADDLGPQHCRTITKGLLELG